ncbi:MAG: cysteine hydrolase [Clostridia bacterium]|nr:cysteine hydrolase [Clostridia bacterium]
MQNFFIVVDMQNDFIDGVLGTKEAQSIVENVVKRTQQAVYDGDNIIFTRDTHFEDYLSTKEGEFLPVPHCVKGTDGWQIISALKRFELNHMVIDKETFGSVTLAKIIGEADKIDPVGRVTLVGVCTDICVISNAMLIKATIPNADIRVDASCTAGVTPNSHLNALNALKTCHIVIENED